MPWDAPLTLVGDSPDQVVEARRQLARIGVDRMAAAVGEPRDLSPDGATVSYRSATFKELAAELIERGDEIVVLDVRRPDEWDEAHIEGAVNIPFYDLSGRQDEVPDGEVWVHCQSGYRASIGASLMDRAGRQVVHIDDDWGNAEPAGIPVTRP